jgi:hypothetical protein
MCHVCSCVPLANTPHSHCIVHTANWGMSQLYQDGDEDPLRGDLLISSIVPDGASTPTTEPQTITVFWLLGTSELGGPCPGCQQAECECTLHLPCPHPPIATHTLADLRRLRHSASQTQLKFNITINKFCSAIWYADVDVRELVVGDLRGSVKDITLEVPHIPGAVLAVAVTSGQCHFCDNCSVAGQFFKVSCRSTDRQSNWNFTATGANGHRFMSTAGSGKFCDRFCNIFCKLWLCCCHRLSAWLLSPRRQSASPSSRQVPHENDTNETGREALLTIADLNDTNQAGGPSHLNGARWVHTDYDDSGWTTRIVEGVHPLGGRQGVWAGNTGLFCGVPAHSYFRVGPFELPPRAPLELVTMTAPTAAI